MKTFAREHSCLVGTSKSKRVTGNVIARRFFDLIVGKFVNTVPGF